MKSCGSGAGSRGKLTEHALKLQVLEGIKPSSHIKNQIISIMMMATDEEAPPEAASNIEEQEDISDAQAELDMACNMPVPATDANHEEGELGDAGVADEEQGVAKEEENSLVFVPLDTDEEAIDFMQEDTSIFEGYSPQGSLEDTGDANEAAVGSDTAASEAEELNHEANAENNDNNSMEAGENTDNSNNETDDAANRDNSISNHEGRDLELGLPLADLDSDNEEEDTTTGTTTDDNNASGRMTMRRRAFYWTRFILHIVFFPVLVITSVAIPVLIVMFCFALMFVAMVVLLCVYYCCSPRRGDQAAVPFHVLIRQILEAVEDETHGLGTEGNDTPKYTREEIKNALVRREVVEFQCSDLSGNVVSDPEPTDEATREERMHQDMFPVISELSSAPLLRANSLSDDEDEPKPTGFASFRKRLSKKRKRKSSKKEVKVVDHNKSYELRMANQNIKFSTDPEAAASKLFLVKRTFVFSPPLGPAKVIQADVDDSSSSSDSDTSDEETRNYNLAVAALEASSSSSSSSRFLQMMASSSSSDSSSDSSTASAAGAATAESSDVSFISESSSNIVGPNHDNDPPVISLDRNGETALNPQEMDSDNTMSVSLSDDQPTGELAQSLSPSSEGALALSPLSGETEPPSEGDTVSIDTPCIAESATEVPSPNASSDNVLGADLDAVLDIAFSDPIVKEKPEAVDINEPGSDSKGNEPGPLATEENEMENAQAGSDGVREVSAPSTCLDGQVGVQMDLEISGSIEGDKPSDNTLPDPLRLSTHSKDVEKPASPVLPSSDDDIADVKSGHNELSPNAHPEGDTPFASGDNPLASSKASEAVANLMIHPAFRSSEETKMEISSGEPSEETKTEIVAYEDEIRSLGEPSEETKTEIGAYDDGEIHDLTPGSGSPLEPPLNTASPMEQVMAPVPAGTTPPVNDCPPESAPTDAEVPKQSTEQPEHRGVSSYCNICLLEYEVGDIVVWSRRPHGCHHVFHDDCLLDWLQRKPTCPNCRQEFFAIEDSPKWTEAPPSAAAAEDNDNSLVEEDNGAAPETTPTRPTASWRRRFW